MRPMKEIRSAITQLEPGEVRAAVELWDKRFAAHAQTGNHACPSSKPKPIFLPARPLAFRDPALPALRTSASASNLFP